MIPNFKVVLAPSHMDIPKDESGTDTLVSLTDFSLVQTSMLERSA